jgi:purine-binding chemotaxis protein CheW
MELSAADLKNDKEEALLSDEEQEKYAGESIRCVLFELNSETYGINVKKVREVLRVSDIRVVEGSHKHVLGVINVRGIIVTVVDANIYYGINSKKVDDLSRIIIVEIDSENVVGMMVDRVLEVKDIPVKLFEPVSTAKERIPKYIKELAHFKGNVILLVDIDNMFDDVNN